MLIKKAWKIISNSWNLFYYQLYSYIILWEKETEEILRFVGGEAERAAIEEKYLSAAF